MSSRYASYWNAFLLLDLIARIESQKPSYEYIPANINWNAAEIKCECQGTLAILDTKQELEHFLSEMYVRQC